MQNPRSVQIPLIALLVLLFILNLLESSLWLLLLLIILLLLLILVWLLDWPRRWIHPPEEYFKKEELIVRGPADAVDRIIENAGGDVAFHQINRLEFGLLGDKVKECLSPCFDVDMGDWVLDLYRLKGSRKDVAAAIKAINRAAGPGSNVSAEANLLTGHPWEPAGSPWEPAGSPWEPAGSGQGVATQASPSDFMKQWAFKSIGLTSQEREHAGSGVLIGIFDTSPYADEKAGLKQISWVQEPRPLEIISDPNPRFRPVPPSKRDKYDLRSHGLFAAGLAHAVAPRATIKLTRVLGDDNRGNLYTLIEALFHFILENMPGKRSDEITGVVASFSLGLRVPPEEAGLDLPWDVQALRDLIRAARCLGIVVVAASGNHSANMLQPEAANLPANWSSAIGVAGSTQGNGRSCFSNQGDLAAPAGDGQKGRHKSRCEPANHLCQDGNCPHAVIGPVKKDNLNPKGFVYWSGTSFATPMVSGLAALVVERGRGQLSPYDVYRIIRCGGTKVDNSQIGNRIIHVANTMEKFDACLEKLGIQLDRPSEKQES